MHCERPVSCLENKEKKLLEQMDDLTGQDCCVAFSGGVDSSLLLRLAMDAAAKNGTRVAAVTFDTVLHPAADMDFAAKAAQSMGAEYHVIRVNELEEPRILENPKDRCYLCKRLLFGKLREFASRKKFPVLLEGTNLDDEKQYRPGIKAVEELGIHSPLRKAGLSKAEVRAMAAARGVLSANRPSAPCLATRLPYGTRIEKEVLDRIDQGEQFLRSLGFTDVRLRLHGEIVRLEVDKKEFPDMIVRAEEVCRHLKEMGFSYITLDLEGFRSGSMDERTEKM